jgi:uncharacterized Rmd1/YagE family protein
LRADINLYSELLEIPDIFWDEHHLEINYKKIAKHLVIESRTSIVNKKIDYSDQLNKALRQQLAEDYNIRLEWLIIILIAIEVVQGNGGKDYVSYKYVRLVFNLDRVEFVRGRRGETSPIMLIKNVILV